MIPAGKSAGGETAAVLMRTARIGSPWNQAPAPAGLGRCALATGHAADAIIRSLKARQIFQRTGSAQATHAQAG